MVFLRERERRKAYVPLLNVGTNSHGMPVMSQTCYECWEYITEQQQQKNKAKTCPPESYKLAEGNKEIIKMYAYDRIICYRSSYS